MAKTKNKGDGCAVLAIIIFTVIAVVAVISPLVFLVGWLICHARLGQRLTGLTGNANDFWLDVKARRVFRQVAGEHSRLKGEVAGLLREAEERNLARKKDGTYSCRTKLGKSIKAGLESLEELEPRLLALAVLPRRKWDDLNGALRMRNAMRAGLLAGFSAGIVYPLLEGQTPLVFSIQAYALMLGNFFGSSSAEHVISDAHNHAVWAVSLSGIIGFAVTFFLLREPAARYSPKPDFVTLNNVDSPSSCGKSNGSHGISESSIEHASQPVVKETAKPPDNEIIQAPGLFRKFEGPEE